MGFVGRRLTVRRLTVSVPLLVVAAVVIAGLTGCGGGSTGPATETVNGTLTINGEPANNVTISFVPVDSTQPTASGPVSDGKFKLYSGVQGTPGAGIGKYKVVLAVAASEDGAAYAEGATGAPVAKDLPFPQIYTAAGTSDEEVEVTAGTNDIAIAIEG